jgi:DNA polymerase-4
LEDTELTASAGVSTNKFVAKAASAMNKPDGLTVVRPDQIARFVAGLKIEKFFGVGRVTAAKFHDLGVRTGADLLELEESELVSRFGRSGRYFFRVARGIDERAVQPHRRRKSVGAERTFFENIIDRAELSRRLVEIADRVWERIERAEAFGRTVTVKIKYLDFEIRTRSHTFERAVETSDELTGAVLQLLATPDWPARPVRLLGVSVSNLRDSADSHASQLSLELH